MKPTRLTKAQLRKLGSHRREVVDQLQGMPERWGPFGHPCEGLNFVGHKCHEPFELNEVIYPRNVFQKLPFEEQLKFHHVFNCSICCRFYHQAYGHRTSFREKFLARMIKIYGKKAVRDWNDSLPLKPENRIKLP